MSDDRKTPSSNNPIGFFDPSKIPAGPQKPETPEEKARLDAEEKAIYLDEQIEVAGVKLPKPLMERTMNTLSKRYDRWKHEDDRFIGSLPDPKMEYGDRETIIKRMEISRSLRSDCQKIIRSAAERTPSSDLRDAFQKGSANRQPPEKDRER